VLFYFKKTRVLPLITGSAAVINIALKLLLVPRFGIMAAAWNTAVAYLIPASLVYISAQRLLPLPINWPRLLQIAAFSGLVLLGCQLLPVENAFLSLLLKGVLFTLFVLLLLRMGVLPRRLLDRLPFTNKLPRTGSAT
jgi:O-antigen/teichoic acid export membrane protein